MLRQMSLGFVALGLFMAFTGAAVSSQAAVKKSVFFISPKDGAEVTSPFKAKFNVKGMTIAPAGKDADDKTKGHMHIIIDGPALAEGVVIPADATHLHFGKGQKESGDIALPAGKHTLTLQLADGLHRAYGPELTTTITIIVK